MKRSRRNREGEWRDQDLAPDPDPGHLAKRRARRSAHTTETSHATGVVDQDTRSK